MSRHVASSAVIRPRSANRPSRSAKVATARLAADDAMPVASGAQALQDLLARRLEGSAEAKWSARATVGLVLLVCGGFWGAVLLVARMVLA